MHKTEVEESKCREFVDEFNRLAGCEQYHYIGLVGELTGEEFPDCLIQDCQTGEELQVECTQFSLDWMAAERANMNALAKRLAYQLKSLGYQQYDIFLQTRNPFVHPLQRLKRADIVDLVRAVKQFLTDQKRQISGQSFRQFDLGHFPQYAPLARMFQFLLITKLDDTALAQRLAQGSPRIRLGVTGFELGEVYKRLDDAIANKLRGPGYTADILLIHSDGLFSFDIADTVGHLKAIAASRNAPHSFKQIWFLSHYWTDHQKLYRIL